MRSKGIFAYGSQRATPTFKPFTTCSAWAEGSSKCPNNYHSEPVWLTTIYALDRALEYEIQNPKLPDI